MRSVGISWDSSAITLVDAGTVPCSGLALGIIAARDVKEGDELCSIPKAACISPLTSSIADIIEAEELGSGLGLVVAVMHEASLGKESKWAGYFAALPPREYMPMFWSKEELESLKGTELEQLTSKDLDDISEDFTTHVAPLLEKYPGRLHSEGWTLGKFHIAASWVASRAFGIDDEHGDGMVPLADVFNHKASVVDLAPGYAVNGAESSSDDELEEEEEEEASENEEDKSIDLTEGQSSSESEEESEEEEEHEAGGDVWGPMRRGDDEPTVHAVYGMDTANGLHLALEIAIMDSDEKLQIVAASDVEAGKEIHNTYGELGNAELVKKYGFALRENPFTAVELDKSSLLEACRELYLGESDKKGTQPKAKRQKKGKAAPSSGVATFDKLLKILEVETDLLEEIEEPFQVLSNGHIGAALFAALRVLCSGAEDTKLAAKSLEDALTLPSGDVLDPGAIGAVQVQVENPNEDKGVPKESKITATKVSKKESVDGCCDHDHCEGHHHSHEDGSTHQELGAMVTPSMCIVLKKATQIRLQRYPTSLDKTLEELSSLVGASSDGGCSALSEGEAAKRAALTLRATEQEVLLALLDSLNKKI